MQRAMCGSGAATRLIRTLGPATQGGATGARLRYRRGMMIARFHARYAEEGATTPRRTAALPVAWPQAPITITISEVCVWCDPCHPLQNSEPWKGRRHAPAVELPRPLRTCYWCWPRACASRVPHGPVDAESMATARRRSARRAAWDGPPDRRHARRCPASSRTSRHRTPACWSHPGHSDQAAYQHPNQPALVPVHQGMQLIAARSPCGPNHRALVLEVSALSRRRHGVSPWQQVLTSVMGTAPPGSASSKAWSAFVRAVC